MEGVDGVSLAIGGGACGVIGGIITAVSKVALARFSRTEITPNPIMVQRNPELVDKPDCEKRMTKIEDRIDRLEEDFDRKVNMIFDKVNACATGIADINGFLRAEHKKGFR